MIINYILLIFFAIIIIIGIIITKYEKNIIPETFNINSDTIISEINNNCKNSECYNHFTMKNVVLY